jgi:hypothetical protein
VIPSGVRNTPTPLTLVGSVLWYYGPCLAAVLVTWVDEGASGIGRLLGRCLIWRVHWRGFALPRMKSRWGSFKASVGLGALRALWHIHPINFGALLSLGGFFELLNIAVSTFIFTGVYRHTMGLLLIAALFHMTINVAEQIVPIGQAQASMARAITQIVLVIITAALVTLLPSRRVDVDGAIPVDQAGTPRV